MSRGIVVVLLSGLLAACQFIDTGPDSEPPVVEDIGTTSGPERVERKVAFPEEEYAKLEKSGTAAITGQLFVKTSQGEIIYGAGETVSVAPATTYSAEAAEAALAGKYIEKADPRAQEYTHYAKTDEQGYFKVTGLPAGVFYVAGRVTLPGPDVQRRVVINQVRLSRGETAKIKLSR